MDAFLAVVRALSHRDRVRIVKLLQYAGLRASELAGIMDAPDADVADHLSILKDSDLVVCVEDERGDVYQANPNRRNSYGAVILALLDGWLNEDPEVAGDRERARKALGNDASP